jgi:hypothetical protein
MFLALLAFPSLAMAGLCDTPQFAGGGCSQTRTAQMQSGWVPSAFGETTDFRCSLDGSVFINWHMNVYLEDIPLPSDGSEITLLELSLDDEAVKDAGPVLPGTTTDGASGTPVRDADADSLSSKGVLSLTLARSATGMRAVRFTWREGDPLASVVRTSRFVGELGPTTLIEQVSGVWPSVDVYITPNRDWSSLDLSVESDQKELIHHLLTPATGVNRVHVPRRLRTGLLGGELADGMHSLFWFYEQPGICSNTY